MEEPLTSEQRWSIQETFSRALDQGVASTPSSPQDFALIVLTDFLGGLQGITVLQLSQIHHFRMLADRYTQTSSGKGVK